MDNIELHYGLGNLLRLLGVIMRYLLILFVTFNLFAAEKFYYNDKGWFGPWPERAVGVETPNGTIECEATIFENDLPIPRFWLKRKANGKLKCPVEISNVRKNEEETKKNKRKARVLKKKQAKERIKALDCDTMEGTVKDMCIIIQGE